MDSTHRVHPNHRAHARIIKRLQIRFVVHFMGRNVVGVTMPGKKHNRLAIQTPFDQFR